MDDWYYVENDPGVPFPQIGDPLAGLSEDVAADVQCLMEGKAIGTAQLSANVLARDAALRATTQADATMMRTRLRQAASNVARSMRPLIREDAQGVPRGQVRQTMRALMREWLGGRITHNQMRLQSAQRLREFYEQMRQIGRRGAGLQVLGADTRIHREEENWFRGAVREELGYWHRFLEQINEGEVPEHQVWRRLDNYVRAMRGFFEATRVQALPDNVLVYWIGPKKDDPTICEGCVLMMEWSPFPKSQLPASPRDGSTPCLTNCRHKVVVRVAKNFNDVIRRANQLDRMRIESRRRPPSRRAQPRDRMVQRLKEAKEDSWHGGNRAAARVRQAAVRTAKPGGEASNPFRGEKLPKVPRYRGRVGRLRMEGKEDPPDADGKETAGIFLRVPRGLASKFPSLGKEDKSPPHTTMLFVGKVDERGYEEIIHTAQTVLAKVRPFVLEVTDYGEFKNPKGQTIAHMIPRVVTGAPLATIHEALYQEAVRRGLQVEHIRDGAFKPHITLAYVDKGDSYTGPRPQSAFRVDALEVWGSGVWFEGNLGNVRVPLGGGPAVAVDEALDEVKGTPYANFDSVPYATMDLRDVARLLQRAAQQRDRHALEPLLDRLLGALEHTVIAIEGRPRGRQVAQMFRTAFVALVDALGELPESYSHKALRLQELLEGLSHGPAGP